MIKADLSAREAQIAEKLDFFCKHPIFGILGPELLSQLRARARVRSVARGTTVFAKGDPGSSLFAILEGQVKVISYSAEGKYAVFNLLSAGDIFGEIAYILNTNRSAKVVAASPDTEVVLFSETAINRLQEESDRMIIWRNLARVLAQKVMITNKLL